MGRVLGIGASCPNRDSLEMRLHRYRVRIPTKAPAWFLRGSARRQPLAPPQLKPCCAYPVTVSPGEFAARPYNKSLQTEIRSNPTGYLPIISYCLASIA